MAPDAGVPGVRISTCAFADLDMATAYAVWLAAPDVFVVEQACPLPDLDGRDPGTGTRHVVAEDEAGRVAGYARVLDDEPRGGSGGSCSPVQRGSGAGAGRTS